MEEAFFSGDWFAKGLQKLTVGDQGRKEAVGNVEGKKASMFFYDGSAVGQGAAELPDVTLVVQPGDGGPMEGKVLRQSELPRGSTAV